MVKMGAIPALLRKTRNTFFNMNQLHLRVQLDSYRDRNFRLLIFGLHGISLLLKDLLGAESRQLPSLSRQLVFTAQSPQHRNYHHHYHYIPVLVPRTTAIHIPELHHTLSKLTAMARTPPRPVARDPDSDEDATDYSSDEDEFPTLKELVLNVDTMTKRKEPIVSVRSVPATPAPTRIARPSPVKKVVTSVRRPVDVPIRTTVASKVGPGPEPSTPKKNPAVPKPAATKRTVTKTADIRRPRAPVPSRTVITIDSASDSEPEPERKPSTPRSRGMVKKADLEKELFRKAAPKKGTRTEFFPSEAERAQSMSGDVIVSSDSDSETFVSVTSMRHDDAQSSSEEEATRRAPVTKTTKRSSQTSGLEGMFSKTSISKPTPRRRLVQKKYLDVSPSSENESDTLPEPPRSRPQPKTAATKKMANIPFVLEGVFSRALEDEDSDEPAGAIT